MENNKEKDIKYIRGGKNMDAVISLKEFKVNTKSIETPKLSRKEELKNFFKRNVMDYTEICEDKSGIDEFENAFIKKDDVTKRSQK